MSESNYLTHLLNDYVLLDNNEVDMINKSKYYDGNSTIKYLELLYS